VLHHLTNPHYQKIQHSWTGIMKFSVLITRTSFIRNSKRDTYEHNSSKERLPVLVNPPLALESHGGAQRGSSSPYCQPSHNQITMDNKIWNFPNPIAFTASIFYGYQCCMLDAVRYVNLFGKSRKSGYHRSQASQASQGSQESKQKI